MAIIKCPECGHQVSDKAATCPSCGVGILGNIKRCPECGEIVFNDQTLCPNCHAPLVGIEATISASPSQDVDTRSGVSNNMRLQDDISTATKQQDTKKKKSMTPWVVAFVLALAVVFIGLYFYKTTLTKNEMEAYENAMQSSEPAVLQSYLDMYNDAPREHRDSIMNHLEMLKKVDADWNNAVVSNSKSALLRYIQMHPNSIHNVEAKIKIDSLDWIDASQKNTAEAYQKYIDEHADGMYIDQAQDAFSQIDARKVNPDDKSNISRIFTTFFNALSENDEVTLTSCIDNIMASFLHKENASKTDVIGYMQKIHQANVVKVEFRMNNDWKIEKIDDGTGNFSFIVNFSVDQTVEHSDDGDNFFNTYKVTSKVSPEGKITELNMQRIVQ